MLHRKSVTALVLAVIFTGSIDLSAQRNTYTGMFTLGTQNYESYPSNSGRSYMAEPGLNFPRYSLINLTGQAVIGGGLTVAFGYPVFMGAFGSYWGGHPLLAFGLGAATIGACIFGAGTGVHWVAGKENRGLSYWKTVRAAGLGAFGGAVITGGIGAMVDELPYEVFIFTLLTPTIGAMIYTNFVADYIPPDYAADNRRVYNDTGISFAQFYNSTKVADMELMRISFSGFAGKGWHNTIVLN